MLNEINRGTTIQPSENEKFETNTKIVNSENCIIKNCVLSMLMVLD